MTARPEPWHASLDLIVRSLLEILVVGIFLGTFVLEPIRIPSSSMDPTLRAGDLALADKQSFADEGLAARLLPPSSIRRGELAVFHFPPDPHRDLVKRIVGLPGDRIRLHGGRVWINGSPLAEPYAFYSPAAADPFRDEFPFLRQLDPNVEPAWWSALQTQARGGEIVVPPDSYFVLGDNRNESDDSRYWGFVPRDLLVSRPLLVYLGAPGPEARTPRQRVSAMLRGIRVLR